MTIFFVGHTLLSLICHLCCGIGRKNPNLEMHSSETSTTFLFPCNTLALFLLWWTTIILRTISSDFLFTLWYTPVIGAACCTKSHLWVNNFWIILICQFPPCFGSCTNLRDVLCPWSILIKIIISMEVLSTSQFRSLCRLILIWSLLQVDRSLLLLFSSSFPTCSMF